MAKVKSVDKDLLVNSLASLRLRAEKVESKETLIDSLVPIVSFDAMSAANTQIIFGRNGTGKTHLLRAFSQSCAQNFESKKLLPVYIDCRDLDLGPALPSIELRDLLLVFFRRFITHIADSLREFTDQSITPSTLERLFGGEASKRQERIRTRFEALKSLLSDQIVEKGIDEYVRKVEQERAGSSTISGGVGLTGKASAKGAATELDATFGASTERATKNREKVELVFRGLSVVDYASIRRELEQIVEQSGAKAIVLLIDEWTAISMDLQPLLAEMIRKTLALSDKVYLKIVALKFFTQTSAIVEPPQRIGFQSGVDIDFLADLDGLLNCDVDPEGVAHFLTLVLYRHTTVLYPPLKQWSLQRFYEYMRDDLFSDEDGYMEAIRASEGNPRDFLSIIGRCCENPKSAGRAQVTTAAVVLASTNHFENNKEPEIDSGGPSGLLFERLFHRVVKNESKVFLISRNLAEHSSALQELWNYRFIHLLSENKVFVTDDGAVHEYSVFSMDYGKLVKLKASNKGQEILGKIVVGSKALRSVDVGLSGLGLGSVSGLVSGLAHIIGNNRKLQIRLGSLLTAHEGVETSGQSFERLVQQCVVDDELEASAAD